MYHRKHGVEYYQQWLVMMTDGVPTSIRHRDLQERLKELSTARKLSVFIFEISNAYMSELSCISPVRSPMYVLVSEHQSCSRLSA